MQEYSAHIFKKYAYCIKPPLYLTSITSRGCAEEFRHSLCRWGIRGVSAYYYFGDSGAGTDYVGARSEDEGVAVGTGHEASGQVEGGDFIGAFADGAVALKDNGRRLCGCDVLHTGRLYARHVDTRGEQRRSCGSRADAGYRASASPCRRRGTCRWRRRGSPCRSGRQRT